MSLDDVGLAGCAGVAVTGGVPRDFVRVALTRPETPAAYLGSWVTWSEFLLAQAPLAVVVIAVAVVGLAVGRVGV
jgi:hypothetical protein